MIALANDLLQDQRIPNVKAELEDIACAPNHAIPLFVKIKIFMKMP